MLEKPAPEVHMLSYEDFAGLLKRNPQLAELMADLVSHRNKKNQAFLEKIKELSETHIEEGTNKHSILARLKSIISKHH